MTNRYRQLVRGTREAIRALAAGCVGNFVEWHDFVIYLYSVPIIATVFFLSGNRATILAAFALWGMVIPFLQTPGSGEAFYREASEPCLLPCTVSEKEFSETEPRYTPRYCPPRGGAAGS